MKAWNEPYGLTWPHRHVQETDCHGRYVGIMKRQIQGPFTANMTGHNENDIMKGLHSRLLDIEILDIEPIEPHMVALGGIKSQASHRDAITTHRRATFGLERIENFLEGERRRTITVYELMGNGNWQALPLNMDSQQCILVIF